MRRLPLFFGLCIALFFASVASAASTKAPKSATPKPAPVTTHILDNGVTRLTFEQRGDGLALVSIQRLNGGQVLSLAPYSGDWRINLKTRNHPKSGLSLALSTLKEVRIQGIDGVMAAGGDWFEAHWSKEEDKAIEESPATEGHIRLKGVQVSDKKDALNATWEGDGKIYDETCRFEVVTRWTLAPGDFATQTGIEVRVLPAAGQQNSPIYLSSVDYPIHRIQAVGEDDHLAAPMIGGHLFHHPTKNKMGVYGNEPGALWMPLHAYYDGKTKDCLYLCNTDVTGHYKLIETRTADNFVYYRVHQVPPDVFESREYKQAYQDVIGVLEGDWITAAETYRKFLADNAEWYKGPIASPQNPTPERVKDCMLVCTLQYHDMSEQSRNTTEAEREAYLKHPGVRNPWKENQVALGKDLKRIGKLIESPIFSIWYAKHYEGSILDEGRDIRRCCAYSDDHTNNTDFEELKRAAAIGQEPPNTIAAPYMNGKNGYLFPLNPEDKGPFTDRNFGALASGVIAENGDFAVKSDDNVTHLCAAAPWWNEHLPQVIADHHRNWGIRGIYLDYYKSFHTCYAETHGHKPGGGDFTIQGKLTQLHRIRELLAEEGLDDFAIGMEGGAGPYSADVNFGNRHIFSNWGRIKESEAIPLAEWVYDNVKYHRISDWGGRSSTDSNGLWAWHMATEVFPFGHIAGIGNGNVSYQELFGEPAGQPYYDFVMRTVDLLTSPGFKPYKNGSLARPLEGTVTPEANFHILADHPFSVIGVPGDVYFDESSQDTFRYARPWILTTLPYGTFMNPNGDIAFAISNPWVGPCPFSPQTTTFKFAFTFDPAKYKDFPGTYRLARTEAGGERVELGAKTGPTELSGELAPGQIVYWTMEKI